MVPAGADSVGSRASGVSAGAGDGVIVCSIHHRDDDYFPQDRRSAGGALAVAVGVRGGPG